MFNLEDYETVEERLIKFWNDHPDGRIDTTLVEHTLQRFIVRASIYRTEVDTYIDAAAYLAIAVQLHTEENELYV